MATLKDHQQAMVDLLASGSGIPASASRLAHAMHDVVDVLYVAFPNLPRTKDEDWLSTRGETRLTITPDVTLDIKDIIRAVEANSPGLNDKALAGDLEACRPKATRFNVDIKLADMEEVKMTLQNMQSHLDGARDSQRTAERRVKELENTVNQLKERVAKLKADQAYWYGRCLDAGILDESQEQAGCRKDDTQVCEHSWVEETEYGTPTGVSICTQCGAAKL